MPNPTLCLTRFSRDFRVNHYFDVMKAIVVGDPGTHTISTYMADCIRLHSQRGDQPRYWSFAEYGSKKHSKEAIRANTAIVLEYPASATPDLLMRVPELGFHHYMIATEDTQSNKAAVIFPLAVQIDNIKTSNRYSRIASCLLNEIGIEGATEGCIASTFLVRPIATARIEAFTCERFLDPDTYIKETEAMKAQAYRFVETGDAAPAKDELFDWGSAA